MLVSIKSLVAIFALFAVVNSVFASEILEGTLEVAYVEDKSGSRVEYTLVQNDPLAYINLKPSSLLTDKRLEHGQPVEITGSYSIENGVSQFVVKQITLIEFDEDPAVVQTTNNLVASVDRRSAVVMMVDFNDATSSGYLTRDYIGNTMYASSKSVRATIEESSYGQVTFDEDTDGDGAADIFQTTLNINATADCRPAEWRRLASQQFRENGVNLSLYQHLVYIFPITTGCGNFRGLGTVGCRGNCFAEVITDQSSMYHTLTHELGHNLSLGHSNRRNSNGTVIEYEDLSDFMSLASPSFLNGRLFEQSKVYQANSVHRYFLGWMDQVPGSLSNIPEGIEQTIDLWVLDKDPRVNNVGTQVVRFPIDGRQDLFLSYRVLDQYDYKQFNNGEPFDRVVNIHREPSNNEPAGSSVRLALLNSGESYTDQQSQIAISVLAINDDFATVTVKHGVPVDQCVTAAPALAVLNARLETPPTGATLSYSFQLKNNDIGNTCQSRNFNLQLNGNATLSLATAVNNISLNPGETRTVSVDASSNVGTPEGTYTFTLLATAEGQSVSADASYVVSSSSGGSGSGTGGSTPVSNARSDGGGGSVGYLWMVFIGVAMLSRRYSVG